MIPPVVGISKDISKIKDLISHVADTGLNVVICGESGVGKEVVAQNLYHLSPRKGKPFVKINCAAVPEGLLESELFGYEPGAFTGAQHRKRGKFELANAGVLMLDEIGDMPLSLQSKLLHVLQNGEFSPVGAEREIQTDAWIMAATNHELENDIRNGGFREDLYYRLNIIRIFIPPLRNRIEDVRPLVDYFMKRYAVRFPNSSIGDLDESIYRRLEAYHWPGNVRELQNILKRMLVLGNSDDILNELLEGSANGRFSNSGKTGAAETGHNLEDLLGFDPENMPDGADLSLKKIKKKAVDRVERQVIAIVLGHTNWNRSKASKILGISYKTLLYKIDDLNIVPPSASSVANG